MSHYTVLQTRIMEISGLVGALADLGLTEVEVHEKAQHLYGFQGDSREQTAEVIVRRKFIGPLGNDLGFKRQADGSFAAIISEFDRRSYSKQWLDQLSQRYAYHVVREQLDQKGFALVEEETREDRTIHLVLRRSV